MDKDVELEDVVDRFPLFVEFYDAWQGLHDPTQEGYMPNQAAKTRFDAALDAIKRL